MTLQNQYDDNNYKNWVRACLGIKFVKDGIVDFIDAEVRKFHTSIINSVCGSTSGPCNLCPVEYLTRRAQQCPNNVCHLICHQIEMKHRFHNPCWQNTDSTKWCSEPWEIAKCFMSPGCAKKCSVAEMDCPGLLSVCINGLFLPPGITGQIRLPGNAAGVPVDLFHKNRTNRNTLLHSGSMEISDAERQSFIQDMIALLQTYKQPVDQTTQEAIDKLVELNTNIFISSTDEFGVLKEKLESSQNDITNLQAQVGDSRRDIQGANDEVDALRTQLTDLDEHQGKLQGEAEAQRRKQAADSSRFERQIASTATSLMTLNTRLNKFQHLVKDDMVELKSDCASLQERNILLYEQLTVMTSCVGHLEGQVDDMKKELVAFREATHVGSIVETQAKKIASVRSYLMEKYKCDELAIPMSPLFRTISANVEDVFVKLTIKDDLIHTPRGRKLIGADRSRSRIWTRDEQHNLVLSYQDVLHDGERPCKNVYIVGKAGVGKTTWCRKLLSTWIRAVENTGTYNVCNENESVLQQYVLVFYIALRHAHADSHVLDMIEHQLFPHNQNAALFTTVKEVMTNHVESCKCLIILDGLDEWCNPEHASLSDGLPGRDPRWRYGIITTTRSWKLEALQLAGEKIERAVEIHGLGKSAVLTLIDRAVTTINTHFGLNKNAADFPSKALSVVQDCMEVPLLLIIFVCMWYDDNEISNHLSELYTGLVHLLIRYAEGNAETRLFQKLNQAQLDNIKRKWCRERCMIPEALCSKPLLVTYLPFLVRLGKLAFNALFSETKETTLVFDHESVKSVLSKAEQELSVNIGILSRTIKPGSILQPEFTLSFLHKTIQEFLAALYIACGNNTVECLERFKSHCNDESRILEMENVLVFLSALCPEMAGDLSQHISETDGLALDERIHRLLLRCVREESVLCSTESRVYIKHHYWYNSNWGYDYWLYNEDTLTYLSRTAICGTVLRMDNVDAGRQSNSGEKNLQGDKDANSGIADEENGEDSILDISECKSVRILHIRNSSVIIQVPTQHLEEAVISYYTPKTNTELDLSGCKFLRKLDYLASSVALRLPTDCLEEVVVFNYTSNSEATLDMSKCTVLRTLVYKESAVPIELPTECLEEVVFESYKPDREAKLDLSRCKLLRKLVYVNSSPILQAPTLSLQEVEIVGYCRSTELVLDLSGCKVLKKVLYRQSCAEIRLPAQCLVEVGIWNYVPWTQSVLDMTHCVSVRKLEYRWSSVAMKVPTQRLEQLVVWDYKPGDESMLDLSKCNVLQTLECNQISVALQLPTEHLCSVMIEGYNPEGAPVLNLSGCNALRSLRYTRSCVQLVVPSECLEKVELVGYRPRVESILDMSRCTELRTVVYLQSSVIVRLPSTYVYLSTDNENKISTYGTPV